MNFVKNKRSSHLTHLTESLEKIFASDKSPLSDGYLRFKVEKAWAEIAGPEMSVICGPASYHNGVLSMWVKHPVYTQDLWYRKADIIQMVNRYVGRNWVRDVVFTSNRKALTKTL